MSSIVYAILDKLLRHMGGLEQVIRKGADYLSVSICLPGESENHLAHRRQRTAWPPLSIFPKNLTTLCRALRYGLCLLVLLTVAAGSTVYADGTSNIVGSSSGTNADQTFFAYANPGEYINYSFATIASPSTSSGPNTVTIRIYSPTGLYSTKTLTAAGQSYAGSIPVTAPTAGIWTVVMDFSVNGGALFITPYNIDVTSTTSLASRINGRVYSTSYYMIQYGGTTADINFYMISEFGYKYSVSLNDYNGIGSRIETTRYGNRKANQCVSLYKSFENGDPTATKSSECGGLYKQFFTPISAALPASAPRYDIGLAQTVTEWLQPPVVANPVINGLTYTPASVGNPAAGSFTATIANYAGNANLQVDVNNNGIYTDAVDRTIPFNVQVGANTINWDGVDGQGNIIPCGTSLRSRIIIDKIGEIHFTFEDVETFGGLKVTRTNGASAPNSVIYWDDRSLTTANRGLTSQTNGTAGVNSNTTNGVHGWANVTTAQYNAGIRSWGDMRTIDNWAYVPNLSVQSEIPFSVACDFGDAPDSYATLIGSNGAAHKSTTTLYLGSVAADGESNGQPTGTLANGDDTNGTDDEDALPSVPPVLVECSDVYSLTVPVTNTTGQTAYVRGWVDFNRNGTFDTGEFASVNVPYNSASPSQTATLTWGNLGTVGVKAGQSYIRLRVSTTNFVSPTGTLFDGEVEDYPVTILPAITFTAQSTDASSCSVADGSVTITATGSSGQYEYSLNGVDFTPFTSPFVLGNLGRGGYAITVRDRTFRSCAGDTTLAIKAPGCCDFFTNQPITGTVFNPGAGITVRYLLTNASGQILSVQNTPSFPSQAIGDYYIYTLAYSTANTAPTGVTVGGNVSGIRGCCYRLYPPDPISVCGCPTVTVLDASYTVCAGQTLPQLRVGTTAVAPNQVEFVYFTTPQTTATAVYGTPTGTLGTATPVSSTAALTNVSFPATPGTYYVYARLTPAPGDPACRPYAQIPVSVSACCALTATLTGTTTVCSGGTITLTASTSGAIGTLSYRWTGPGNFSTVTTTPSVTIPTATTSNSGSYTVVITDAGATNCSATSNLTVLVQPAITVTATADNATVCVGSPLSLSASVNPAGTYTYAWSGPNGYTGSGASPTVSTSATVSQTGTYTVVVTDASSGCSGTAVVAVTVQNCCFDLAATSNSPVCATNTLQLNAFTQRGSGNFTYAWTGPNGFSSNQPNPTIPNATTAASGSYTLVVTDVTAACSQTVTTPVTIATQPVLAITASPGLTICSGQSTTLTVGGANGTTVTWTNSLGASGTGTSIATGILTNNGTAPLMVAYYLSASTGTGGNSCSDQDTILVVVNPAPQLQIIPSSSVVCNLEQVTLRANASPAASTINWTRTPNTPGTATGTGTGSVLIQQTLPVGAYTYQFTATAPNGCSSQPISVPVTVQQ